MLCNLRIYLPLSLIALLFLCFANIAHGYGMECEKPTIVTAAGIATPFTFNCKNSTTGAHFASYEIFPVCMKDSAPAGICDTIVFTATGCPNTIAPGDVCEVTGNFMAQESGVYILDFNDKYGSVTYSNIFCNDSSKGCITADATPFAYVPPSAGADLINQCPLNIETGEFLSCATAYSNDEQSYRDITFAVVSGKQYGYVTDQHDNDHGFVYQCFIKEDGSFEDCTKTTPTLPVDTDWAPYAIAFATVGGVQYAYVTDVNSAYTYQCSLDSDGNFTSCKNMTPTIQPPSSPPIYAPYAIDFATVNGTQYAYIGDAGPGGADTTGQVFRCTINIDNTDLNNNGLLETCTPTISPPGSDSSWIPYGIDFASIDGTQYAYVADNGSNSHAGKMYQCTLNTQGLFTQCIPQDPPSSGWSPAAIALATLNGTQYAYVGSTQNANGNMYRCTLIADGGSDNGSFASCKVTPSSSASWFPQSIAFRFN